MLQSRVPCRLIVISLQFLIRMTSSNFILQQCTFNPLERHLHHPGACQKYEIIVIVLLLLIILSVVLCLTSVCVAAQTGGLPGV